MPKNILWKDRHLEVTPPKKPKKLTATLKMKVPNNFVQFYIPDTNAGIAYDT